MTKAETKKTRGVSAQSRVAKQALERAQPMEMDVAGQEGHADVNPNETFHEIVFSDAWKKGRAPEYAAYREAWVEVPKNKTTLEFPIHLDIETTNVCNLRCPMCPRTLMVANQSFSELGFMTRDDYARIIDEGARHGLRSVKLNYLGEPLAHPDVVWQVQYAKERGIIDVMMNSNASLLTSKMGEELLKAGLDNMFVSFDAIDPADFEVQRTGTSLGKVIDNVYEFTRLRDELRPSCQIRLSMVMYKDPKWLHQFEAMKVMWERHIDALGYGYYVDRDANAATPYRKVAGFYCAQPFQRMFLKYNGNVTICCVDDRDETVVGNWREDSIQSIWLSHAYQRIRDKHAEGNYYDIEMCRKCYFPYSK